jgi:hypothetical protein
MSGSDWTQTPNLKLYKPVYDADAESWGLHLNANADTLDLALGTSGAGALFLPLVGGTLTGPLTVPSITQNTANQSTFGPSAYFQASLFDPSDPGRVLSINRAGSNAADSAVASLNYTLNDTGGTLNSPRFGLTVNTAVQSTPVNGLWALHSAVSSQAVGGNLGGNGSLALDLQAIRPSATPIGNTTVATTLSAPGTAVAVANVTNFATGYYPVGAPAPGTSFPMTSNPGVAIATTSATAVGGTVLNMANVNGLHVGMNVAGQAGIPLNTTILSIAGNAVTISQAVTASVSGGVDFQWGMMVKVGATIYTLTGTSVASGAGTLTFSTPVSVADATAGNQVLSQQGGAPIWALVIDAQDQTGLPSSAGGVTLCAEIDISGNGPDDGSNVRLGGWSGGNYQGNRSFITFVASKYNSGGADFQMSSGLQFAAGSSGVSVGSLIASVVPFYHAMLDTRSAQQLSGANAVWLAQSQTIAFEPTGNVTLSAPDGASLAVSAQGLKYALAGGNEHAIAFGWDGTSVLGYVDGSAGMALYPRSGGAINGPLIVNYNSGGAQPSGGSAAITTNFTNAWSEVDFWNQNLSPVVSFAWYQATGATTQVQEMLLQTAGLTIAGGLGVHGASASSTKPTVTGAKGSNAALASLMSALAAYGLVTDSTTA